MNTTRKNIRWLGLLVMSCGLFVIIYLAVTEGKVSEWIFPTGIVASWMIATGFWLLIRRARA